MSDKKLFTVYMHIFPNNKKYIGITKRKPRERWRYGHGYRNQQLIWNAIKKYGWDNIKHKIIKAQLTLAEANKLEQELINKYKTTDVLYGYNIREGGKVAAGWHHSEKTKQLLRKKNKGKNKGIKAGPIPYIPRSTYYQYNLQGKLIAKYIGLKDASKKSGISEGMIVDNANNHSRVCSNKYVFSTSKLTKKQVLAKIQCKSTREWYPIYQYDKNGFLIEKYKCLQEAAAKTKLKIGVISLNCNGYQKTYSGYVFSKTKLSRNKVLQKFKHALYPKEYNVYQYNLEGKLLNVFDNVNKAAEITKINKGTIRISGISKKYICNKKYIFSKTKLTKGEIKKRVMRSNRKYQ